MNRRQFVRSTGAAALGVGILPPVLAGVFPGGSSGRAEAATPAASSAMDERALRRLFDDVVKRSGAVGAQLSLIKGDQQIDFAAGLAHAQRRIPMTTDTLMQIGSVTKVFNAAIAMSLVQEGKLDLDAPVKNYLPTFAVADAQASRTLTLRRLMSMSSGLDNGLYVYFGGGDDALGRYVDSLKTLPQNFTPGKYFGYSNAGICVAGHVASRVTGKPWETLMHERILQPAQLTQAALLEADVLYQKISAGHHVPDGGGKPEIIDPVFTMARGRTPSGACFALSAAHLARFGKIFVRKGVADSGARILSAASVEQMMTRQVDVPTRKYGDGWGIGPCMGTWNGVKVWGHGGTSLTATSFLYWFPERQGVIAFVVNTHSAMAELAKVAFGDILQTAFGFDKPAIDVPQNPLGPVNPKRYIGVYEELGGKWHVAQGDGNTLKVRMVSRSGGKETGTTATLAPLGGDRFLVKPPGGPDKHRGVVDTAFFGDDGQGRATNVLNLVFPMHRVAD